MEKIKLKKPVAAGQFYPASAKELRKQIEGFIQKDTQKSDVIACILPHAGYIYSGKTAADTVSRINIKDKIILLGPNHTGNGAAFSIMSEGSWQTPLGEVKIDNALAKEILGHCRYLQDDELAHLEEHSLEVELPLLQYFKSDFSIVPIAISSDNLKILKEIGRGIAEAVIKKGLKGSILIVASSDMTHYEPQKTAEKKDFAAIEAILALDEDMLAQRIKTLDISMCGYMPVIVMLSAAKALGAKEAKLIRYSTSADATGDNSSVVGYAGLTVS